MARHLMVAFVITIVVYVAAFSWIEHRRVFRGPWQLRFSADSKGVPSLLITQTNLGIHDVQVVFPEEHASVSNVSQTLFFNKPAEPPIDLPFGQCVFEDLTFLPGTLTIQLYGHELELLPRVLVVNKLRRDWTPGETITLYATNKLPHLFQPKPNTKY